MLCVYDYQIFQAQKYGGVSRYFYELISRLVGQEDLAISLFEGFHISRYPFRPLEPKLRASFSKKVPASSHLRPMISFANRLFFRSFLRRENPQIYHSTYYADPAPKFQGRRVVTVYDMIHETFPHEFSGDPTSARKRAAVERADHVLTISHATKADLVHFFGVPEAKISVTQLANSLVREVADNPKIDRPFLLYVGNRGGYKNFHFLLTAFSALDPIKKNLRLICFGGGSWSLPEKNRIQELGLQDSVSLVNGDDQILAAHYRSASAFVYPSLYEGFGLPVLEAMHYRCPVVCSNTSSLPEVAGDAALYIDPTNQDSLVGALEQILNSSTLAATLRARGIERERRFSWDRCAQETLTVYRGLIG